MGVHQATLADVDDLISIENQAFLSDRITRRSFANFASNPRAVLLIKRRKSQALGYILIMFHPAGRVARVYSLAVANDARRTGVGTALLFAAEYEAQDRRVEMIRLEVKATNLSAQRLYQQSGFGVFGRHCSYYADGTDALRLQKYLQARSRGQI